jgi:protoporphyrin/coproporphyrin ferrochelatase
VRFDAVLIISFGGPQGPDDVRPFLQNVLRGRPVAPGRIDEVAHHYEVFGGVSPITQLTRRQADGLARVLAARGTPLPVYVGMRNWHPFIADTLAEMSRAGIRHVIGFIAAAHAGYSSCEQYRRNVDDARRVLRERGLADVDVTYVSSWYDHPLFIEANARHLEEALARLPASLRAGARLVFTAHSVPLASAVRSRYREQLAESARLVSARLDREDWALVYQSRSGRPEDPWLEPDIGDYLRQVKRDGVPAAAVSPIGFVSDHVEVLYDLDREAAGIAGAIGLPMTRAAAVNDSPVFLDMMADVVTRVVARYASGRPLSIVAPSAPALAPAARRG